MKVHLSDITAAEVANRLEEARTNTGSALGRVLTLVIQVPGEAAVEAALDAAESASHSHPCRVIVLVPDTSGEDGTASLSAEIRVGADAGMSEVAILRPRGEADRHRDTLVLPLLLPDTHVVVWWFAAAPASPSTDPVGQLATRRITTSIANPLPVPLLEGLAASYSPGDTDLAWAGCTLWRAYLAAMLDEPPHLPVTSVEVVGSFDHASTYLLASWLGLCFNVRVTVRPSAGFGVEKVVMTREDGELIMERKVGESMARLQRPGRTDLQVRLDPRTMDHMLIEDLQRMSGDDMYGDVLRAFTTGNTIDVVS